MNVHEITPRMLVDMMASDIPPVLVDVRTQIEASICQIDGSLLIPLDSLSQHLGKMPADRPIVVYCHHGSRSLTAARYLAQSGYEAVSLAGGIDRWAIEVAPEMARY
ncbi:MAG TPA: rhodanese-like domain-containing protein [Thermoanaerobaculia bacterium]|nr:rhodanese-like domain-containing protein [Thermoanaerobaculia bacterium]